jgi:hypothetical protein
LTATERGVDAHRGIASAGLGHRRLELQLGRGSLQTFLVKNGSLNIKIASLKNKAAIKVPKLQTSRTFLIPPPTTTTTTNNRWIGWESRGNRSNLL